ncbi:MAG TPA: transferrin receptor-like dimerization domain-containing protein [Gammaproteobacteria bacterium]|nr:transferrin receptor-like dimerization domain-containing protein [Gammaproteobacteria bacterium]
MHRLICRVAVVVVAALAASATAFAATNSPMLGFTAAGAAREQALEAKFDAALDRHEIRDWLKTMSSEPNNVGSPHDKANAERMLKMFKSWGYDAHIATYKVLFPTPKVRELELVAPSHYKATLREPPVKGDPTSDIYKNALPPYNAYSGDGDVTAQLVYVNYGLKDDYKALARRGISVKGKIVIARYGHSWRGNKVRYAQQHGAIGCIIYSDPRDDGYRRGNAFPKGGWRDRWSVQRGSVMRTDGDPLTPGYASVPGAKRIPRQQADGIKKIPVLPLSYADALPLLKALGGRVAPDDWQGALPITYHIGPGPAKVHLKVVSNWDEKPIYDVIAKIPGSVYPNQWVMRGNHHDAWVFGASDPLSSNVAMLEGAKAIGQLLKTGWRPKRTIIYMSWDAEEPGLIGSVEWQEQHAKELAQKGVVYINSDNTGRGFLRAGGSGSLQTFMNEVARSVPDPETGVNVLKRARAHRLVRQLKHPPQDPAERVSADPDAPYPLSALGSGSDYTGFLDHLGIMALDIRFGGEGEGTQYHSRYDDFYWYSHFADPTFKYGVALAKVGGHAMLRFANADVLPYAFTSFADKVANYAQQIEREHKKMVKQTQRKNALIQSGAFKLAADPTKQYVPPQPEAKVPALDFKQLDEAVARLKSVSSAYDQALRQHIGSLSGAQARRLNQTLVKVSRQLLYSGGLPHQKWFRQMIYAPNYYLGYSVSTLPGIREAVDTHQWDTAQKYIGIVAHALNGFSSQVDKATALLNGA